jgi:hypothetical protein
MAIELVLEGFDMNDNVECDFSPGVWNKCFDVDGRGALPRNFSAKPNAQSPSAYGAIVDTDMLYITDSGSIANSDDLKIEGGRSGWPASLERESITSDHWSLDVPHID